MNQPPVISSLTPAQSQVYPLSIIEIQCVASDPDGDAISYAWSTTGGKFTGTGPTVSWIAPEHYGPYEVTVTVQDDGGNSTIKSITLSVVANRDPQILSLVAAPDTVLPDEQSTITCLASDPDGDALSYSWRATDGNITGVGATVTWIAPDREGEFTITVIVDDGKGGQNAGAVSVTVLIPAKTVSFNPVLNETGTVSSTGDKDTSRTIAGDKVDNIGYHTFWSFDLYSLRGTDVKDAKLTFTMKREPVGEPFDKDTGLGGLHIFAVRYEPGQLPNFTPDKHSELHADIWQLPTVIDVTDLVSNIGRGISASDRLQIEASFMNQTNGNHIRDYVEWEKVTLPVTYAER
ncbi:MAG: PKD domain-containing protein [Dehalococcoidia bacterium]|nr:PKD domain-containing protein [Dehalococcoidia bacterium]